MRGIDEVDDPTMFFQIPDPGWEDYQNIVRRTTIKTRSATERSREDTGWVFHANNPHVLLELRRLALQLVDAGHRHYSIKGLFEVLRWKTALKTNGKPYKLNNNLTAFYARLLMETEPRLDGFFHLRTRRLDV